MGKTMRKIKTMIVMMKLIRKTWILISFIGLVSSKNMHTRVGGNMAQ